MDDRPRNPGNPVSTGRRTIKNHPRLSKRNMKPPEALIEYQHVYTNDEVQAVRNRMPKRNSNLYALGEASAVPLLSSAAISNPVRAKVARA